MTFAPLTPHRPAPHRPERPLVDCLADLAVYGVGFDAAPARPHIATVTESPLTAGEGGFARFSAPLRNFVVRSGTLIAHPYPVGLLASAGGRRCHLRPMLDPAAFVTHLSRGMREVVTRRIATLREERIPTLSGGSGGSDLAIDRAIIAQVIAPRLEQELAAYCGRPVDLRADAATAPDFDLPVTRVNDPLAGNVVVLALRRAYFGGSKSGHTRLFNLTPHAFARVISRRNHLTEADFAAALASIQVTLLTFNKARLH